MLKPVVSIIIPSKNRASLINRALKSVINQTFQDWECIVIDDFSEDNTKEAVLKIKDDRIKYYRNDSTLGAAASRNKGLNLSRGKYIAFLDSDDEWFSQKLEKQFQLIESLPVYYGLVYCWMNYYDGNRLVYTLQEENKGNLFPDIISRIMTGGTPTLLIRKEVISNVGGFDERIKNGDDQDFIRRIAKEYKIDFVPEVLVNVYINHRSQPRLSDLSIRENILALIDSYKITLEKFEEDLKRRPDLKASLYTSIAQQYSILGDINNFIYFTGKAWLNWPFRGRIKSTIRGLKTLRNFNK